MRRCVISAAPQDVCTRVKQEIEKRGRVTRSLLLLWEGEGVSLALRRTRSGDKSG